MTSNRPEASTGALPFNISPAHACSHQCCWRRREAIHLLEIVTTANPGDRRAQGALRQAHLNLRNKAIATTNNTYEIDWLSLRIRQIDVLLTQEN